MKILSCFSLYFRYLKPLDLSDAKKKENAQQLVELRNNIALGMAMINLLWIAINFMFQFQSPTTIPLKLSVSINYDVVFNDIIYFVRNEVHCCQII